MAFNIVELIVNTDGDECAFDQRCVFGHRVESHAIYCHNDQWEDAPRKCHRSWYTSGRIKDEDCPGFEANPQFSGILSFTPIFGSPCLKCGGTRKIATERNRIATCPQCIGSGTEPAPIKLTQYEQDTLECGTTHSGHHDTAGHAFVQIAETEEEGESIHKLCELGLVSLRSITYSTSGVRSYLLENTMKGEAVLRQNWKARHKSKP